MAKILLVVKYTFFILILFGAGLTIERLSGIKRWWTADLFAADDDLFYNASSSMASKNFHSDLNKHYRKCVTQPAKPFCLLSANRRLEIFRSGQADSPNAEEIERRLQNITFDTEPRRRKIHSLLITFTKVMKSNDIKVILIEPSMLFCLLSPAKKFDMLSKGFNPGKLLGSKNVVTVGILDSDSKKLEASNFTEVLSADFKIIKFRRLIGKELGNSFETVHYFFVLHDVAVHAVIFYPRNSYVWHAGLDPKEIDFEGLLFVNEGIFKNFTLLPLDLVGTSISQFFLPIDIQHFMREMETSRILKCKSNSSGIVDPASVHPSLNKDQLRLRVEITFKELENILAPQVVFFWLWSKSLLGWFEECDILYHSATLELAVTYKSVEGFNFTELLDDNEFLKVENGNQSSSEFQLKLDCHELRINIFIFHEDKDGLWYRHSKEKEKLTYPEFELCSTQILGQKIHVPCSTDDILKLEFSRKSINLTSENGSSESNLVHLNETGR